MNPNRRSNLTPMNLTLNRLNLIPTSLSLMSRIRSRTPKSGLPHL
jgi:hypothetical protein